MYPQGARLKKLQRDVAWRMNRKESPGKLNMDDQLMPVVGVFLRKGLLQTRSNRNGSLVIVHPQDDKVKEQVVEENSENNAA